MDIFEEMGKRLDSLLGKKVRLENATFIIDQYETILGGAILRVSNLDYSGKTFNGNERVRTYSPLYSDDNILAMERILVMDIEEVAPTLKLV